MNSPETSTESLSAPPPLVLRSRITASIVAIGLVNDSPVPCGRLEPQLRKSGTPRRSASKSR